MEIDKVTESELDIWDAKEEIRQGRTEAQKVARKGRIDEYMLYYILV
jgi:hypothetical protein